MDQPEHSQECHLAKYLLKVHSKTCLKRPIKNRRNKDLNDKW